MANASCLIEMSDTEIINMVNVFRVEFDDGTTTIKYYYDTTTSKDYTCTADEYEKFKAQIKRTIGLEN